MSSHPRPRPTPHRKTKLLSFHRKALEKKKSAADERIRGLQGAMAELGAGGGGGGDGGIDRCGGSEALQKELSRTLTDLAKASTEVSWYDSTSGRDETWLFFTYVQHVLLDRFETSLVAPRPLSGGLLKRYFHDLFQGDNGRELLRNYAAAVRICGGEGVRWRRSCVASAPAV